MSTFTGFIDEFPEIRVDYFRRNPELRPPLACFLSHVHSDHLAGLESFKAPFLYCSAATKELLLRLERYPHRVNFAKGILESRKQQYKHLQNLLKPIPLETPTRIELEPGNFIQVTLFDANHCTGAVMFLFERNGKAVLYTGDIRSEPWFVNSLTRNPFLIEYTTRLKTLDCIYLDTSNLEPIAFPPKAEGLKELLHKVSKYPKDTIFHFSAWTFGYEEVWMALSKALNSPIHVDGYKLRLYQSLRGNSANKDQQSGPFLAPEGPILTGYKCGNTPQAGYLTSDEGVRLHSCEKHMKCPAINDKTVWIGPIVTRTKFGEIREIGIGGGGGDLIQQPELVLADDLIIDQLLGQFTNTDDIALNEIKKMLQAGLRSSKRAISLDEMGLDGEEDNLSIEDFTKLLAKSFAEKRRASTSKSLDKEDKSPSDDLPNVIKFPYSRHSSYAELCDLVRLFQPRDVYPCTFDSQQWHEMGYSIRTLFGHECSGASFRHDKELLFLPEETHSVTQQTQTTDMSQSSQNLPPSSPVDANLVVLNRVLDARGKETSVAKSTHLQEIVTSPASPEVQNLRRKSPDDPDDKPAKRARLTFDGPGSSPTTAVESGDPGEMSSSIGLRISLDVEASGSRSSSHMQYTHETQESSDSLGSSNHSAHNEETMEIAEVVRHYLDTVNSYYVDYAYYHPDDAVVRCCDCHYELEHPHRLCARCSKVEDDDPYLEVIDPEAGTYPEIVLDECSEVMLNKEQRKVVVGDYLDDDSSAYDSLDSDEDFNEEYEVNSFIDDASTHHQSEDEDESNDEVDWQAKYEQLDGDHRSLNDRYKSLLHSYVELDDNSEEFKRDIMGSDYEGDEDDDDDLDDMDENGILLIDPPLPKTVITEIVLDQAREQSQESEVLDDMIRDRVEAFEAARDGNWHEMSMVSTGDYHTLEEVEL